MYVCEHVFHFIWSDVQIKFFFSFVLLFVEMHKRRGKKLTGIKMNIDRQFFKYVIEFSDFNLCNLIEGGGVVPIVRKDCHPFPPFPFTNICLSNDFFYIFYLSIFIATTPHPAPPLPILMNHFFSLESKLKHTAVDIACIFSRCKIFANKRILFYGNVLQN